MRYYLSLGDSLAAGAQPTGDPAAMYRTDRGYADQLAGIARGTYPNLAHVKLGCPGETSATMIAGGICAYPKGCQLSEAVAFLKAHRGFVAFVTIDIGWNDFPCTDSIECVAAGAASIAANLPTILTALRGAAGPDVPIVGMTVYNAYLAAWLTGPDGQAFAKLATFAAIVPINDLVEGIYAAAGMSVADVEGAFATTDFTTIVPLPGFGDIPLNVARIFDWTWACAPAPYGPDNHANDEGYRRIALAFADVLGLYD